MLTDVLLRAIPSEEILMLRDANYIVQKILPGVLPSGDAVSFC